MSAFLSSTYSLAALLGDLGGSYALNIRNIFLNGYMENDFVDTLNQCENTEQSWVVFLRFIKQLGFNSAFYGLSFPSHKDNLPGIYLSNYNDDFLTEYDRLSGAFDDFNDTALQWCFDHDVPLEWSSDTHLALQTPQSASVDYLANDFGMTYGVSIPIRSRSHLYIAGAGVCAEGVNKKTYDNEIAINIPTLVRLTNLYHAYLNNTEHRSLFMPNVRTSMNRVTELELETIKLLAAGLTIKEIADKRLFKSIESVNLYIRAAKKKLQVKTSAQLVARAMVLGII